MSKNCLTFVCSQTTRKMTSKHWFVSLNCYTENDTTRTSWIEDLYVMVTEDYVSKQKIKAIVLKDFKERGLNPGIRDVFDYSKDLFELNAKRSPNRTIVYHKSKRLQRIFIGGRYYHVLAERPVERDIVLTGNVIRTYREDERSSKCFPKVYTSDKLSRKLMTFCS